MNDTIDPCVDFYQFACDDYLRKTAIPVDKGWVDSYSAVEDDLRYQLKDILTKERNETVPRHYRLPGAFYSACMNEELIENSGAQYIHEIAKEVGGWPVIVGDCWNANKTWTWQGAVKKSRHIGLSISSILEVSVVIDIKNNTRRIIQLDQPWLDFGVDREYLVKGVNHSFVSAYYKYMVDLAILFGAETKRAEEELMESLLFEINLAQISWPIAKKSNISNMYNLRSIRQLQRRYRYVDWVDYFNALLPNGIQVTLDEMVNLAVPSFFDGLDKLLKETSNRTKANYMLWRSYDFAVDHISRIFRDRKTKFNAVVMGKKERGFRTTECVDIVSKRFSASVGSLYVQEHFQQTSKDAVREMAKNIHNVFKKALEEAVWINGTTKQRAKAKLDLIYTRIGYPNELLNDTTLEKYYQGLNISDPDNYLKSSLMLNVFHYDNAFKNLRLQVNRADWTTFDKPAAVTSYYNDYENSITFPAGLLQGVFFNLDRHVGVNYGGIGYIMAHEMTHGFDDVGRQFDEYGALANWWDDATTNAFLERAKCIIEQYGNYTDKQTGLKLNGTTTQSENIADNAGIKLAYSAYTKWLNENNEELLLPGLQNFTSRQLFWLSAAQVYCSKYTDAARRTRILARITPPGNYRVLVPFSNMKDFSNDFQCAEGTPMNPVKKCGVW